MLGELKTSKRTAAIPIVLVSNLPQKRSGVVLSVDEFLVKPVSQSSLMETLLRWVPSGPLTSVMAVVFGLSGGSLLALATAWLLVQGGEEVGPHLGLLGNYFPGYTVTWPGVAVGFGYGLATGGILGWVIASLYNRIADLRNPG